MAHREAPIDIDIHTPLMVLHSLQLSKAMVEPA